MHDITVILPHIMRTTCKCWILPHLSVLTVPAVSLFSKFECETVCKCVPVLSTADDGLASRPGSRSAGVLTQARPSSALASVMSLLMGNPEEPPFRAEPSIGAIEPGALQNISIRFSPLELAQFQGRLVCR